MDALGFNYRITDFQCALGLSQLKRVDGWVARRSELAAHYRELLAGETRIELPPEAAAGERHAYHLLVIRVLSGREPRRLVFEGLREAGIGVQVHYIPVYRLLYYRDALGYPQDECPMPRRCTRDRSPDSAVPGDGRVRPRAGRCPADAAPG